MEALSDSELLSQGFMMLVKTFGDVNAERFIVLTNREPRDYTKWRPLDRERQHLGWRGCEAPSVRHPCGGRDRLREYHDPRCQRQRA